MKKIDYARYIVRSDRWDGYTKNEYQLAQDKTKEELKEIYDAMLLAEEDMI